MPKVNEPSVVKVIELIGSSSKGWDDAAANAVKEAARTVRNIKGIELKRCSAKVEQDKIVEYRAVVKVAFDVERESQILFSFGITGPLLTLGRSCLYMALLSRSWPLHGFEWIGTSFFPACGYAPIAPEHLPA